MIKMVCHGLVIIHQKVSNEFHMHYILHIHILFSKLQVQLTTLVDIKTIKLQKEKQQKELCVCKIICYLLI